MFSVIVGEFKNQPKSNRNSGVSVQKVWGDKEKKKKAPRLIVRISMSQRGKNWMSHVVTDSRSGPSPAHQGKVLVSDKRPMQTIVSVSVATGKLRSCCGEHCSYPSLVLWFGNQNPRPVLHTPLWELQHAAMNTHWKVSKGQRLKRQVFPYAFPTHNHKNVP